ncbi:MAG: signal peptide peptidase SppA [bacterium]|nr:signal peptide peptidase SppA [bacterium]
MLKRFRIPLSCVLAAFPVVGLKGSPATAATAVRPVDLGTLRSVALADDASGLAYNPAGLGATTDLSLLVAREFGTSERFAALFHTGSLGLGLLPAPGSTELDPVLATGLSLWPGFRLGWSYRLAVAGRPSTQDLGWLWRPARFLSLGAMASNVLATSGIPSSLRLGAAFRPFGERFTLALDLPVPDRASWSWAAIRPEVGIELEPLDGLRLRADMDPQGQFRLGFGLALSQVGASVMTGQAGGSAQFRLVGAPERTVLRFHGSRYATLDLSRTLDVVRLARGGMTGSEAMPGLYPLLEAVREAGKDPEIAALVVRVNALGLGLAETEELREALARFRSGGKLLWVHVDRLDLPTAYLASVADRVLMHPMASVSLTGVSEEKTYLRGLLDQLGIQPQFVAVGRYKSAMETFERTGPSEGDREQTRSMLEDTWNRLMGSLARDRKQERTRFEAAMRRGVFTPSQAMEAGFVDELAEHDQLRPLLERFLARAISPVAALRLGHREPAWALPEVAVLAIEGSIAQGGGGRDLMLGETVGSDPVCFAVRRLAEDPSVAAVVVRVDSPGGDAFASELIRRELELLARRKPVVVSLGNVAASGGYWLSMLPGVKVFADRDTVTGSIGVISGKFSLAPLLEKWGVTRHVEHVGGENGDMFSPARPLTELELGQIRVQSEEVYQRFVTLVASQRKLSEMRVRELGGGRVYTGEQALGLGLVDATGGFGDALHEALDRAHLVDQPHLVAFHPRRDPLLLVLQALDPSARAAEGDVLDRAMRSWSSWARDEVRALWWPGTH